MGALLVVPVVRVSGLANLAPNMNGEYGIANPHNNGKFSSNYSQLHPTAEYFDVYSPPISTKYGQVFWTMMDEVQLDPQLVQRFDNKTIAIVGYEADQVIVSKDGAGKIISDKDQSVPISW
jgi:hypothetical protein